MDGRLEDFVREAVALVAREIMEAEISGEIGAELGDPARSPHEAKPARSGRITPARRRMPSRIVSGSDAA